jgi:hypothetical protein
MCNNARMAVTLAQMQTHLDAARAYLAAGSYASARNDVMAAWACLAAMPNMGQEGATLMYRNDCQSLLKAIDRLESAASTAALTDGPFGRTKVTYKKTTT